MVPVSNLHQARLRVQQYYINYLPIFLTYLSIVTLGSLAVGWRSPLSAFGNGSWQKTVLKCSWRLVLLEAVNERTWRCTWGRSIWAVWRRCSGAG